MIMKKQSSSLRYGNKGIIFTLDVLLAVTLVIVLLVSANFYIFSSSDESSVNVQMIRTESDILTLLDNTKTLDTLDSTTISNSLDTLNPVIYGVRLNISWQTFGESQLQSFEVGDPIPDDGFIASGKSFFLVTDDAEANVTDFGVARYWVWLK